MRAWLKRRRGRDLAPASVAPTGTTWAAGDHVRAAAALVRDARSLHVAVAEQEIYQQMAVRLDGIADVLQRVGL